MSTSELTFAPELPSPPARIFCVGIGGIGVSGLAQLLAARGYSVAGSDRGLHDAGKEHLYAKLESQGIRLYPQDGSGVLAEKPDALVISTAVEPGNPDLAAAPDTPVVHRARALAQTLNRTGAIQIAIAGSCGKTSVTGWIADALRSLGHSVLMVNGGYSLDAESPVLPGNFLADDHPEYAVVEVDESDKSLCEFTPHYGVLLNVGNDHYSQDELNDVFRNFLGKCSRGITVLNGLRDLAASCTVPINTFASAPEDNALAPLDYTASADGIHFHTADGTTIHSGQSGRHSALNACAVLALLRQLPLQVSAQAMADAVGHFSGIRQRFEIVGKTAKAVPVVNDYAHNPEKIAAALSTARERFGSPLIAVFQPHGFRPLQFMRAPLANVLKQQLGPEDTLLLLPVFYAGGTASFSPTSDDVAADLQSLDIPAKAVSREEAQAIIASASHASCAIVMGARDASLRSWSIAMTR